MPHDAETEKLLEEKPWMRNLGQYSDKSREEYLSDCAKGGRNSMPARRKKRALRELCQFMLDAELLESDDIREELEARGFDQTGAGAMLIAQLHKAMSGDTDAAKFMRDTSGNKPTELLALGNIDNQPFETIDLASLSDEQLRHLIENRTE